MRIKIRVEVTDKSAPPGDTIVEEMEVFADRDIIDDILWDIVGIRLVEGALHKLADSLGTCKCPPRVIGADNG